MKRIKYKMNKETGLLESKVMVSQTGGFFKVTIEPDYMVTIDEVRTGRIATYFENATLALAKVKAKETLVNEFDVRFEDETRTRFPAPELLKAAK